MGFLGDLGSEAVSLGNNIGKSFDFSFGTANKATSIPKQRVLSAHASLKLTTPTFGDNLDLVAQERDLDIAEFDSFSAKKSFKVVKSFKPFGSKFEKKIIEDAGWELQFTCSKVDWNLAYLFYAQEKLLSGLDIDNASSKGNTFGEVGSFYNKPLFAIEHVIEHYDGTTEAYMFCDVSILEYEQVIDENMAVIKESFTAFSPFRRVMAPFDEADKSKITDRVQVIINTLNSVNRS